MKILGVELIPLNEPLHRRIEALSAGAYFCMFTFGGYLCILLCVYLLFTPIWWLSLIYACWLYLDRNTCEIGGRSSSWVQNWTLWWHLRNYFPIRSSLVPDFKLNPKKNYFFCCFPHGILPVGPFSFFTSARSELKHPELILRIAGLEQLFHLPIIREITLGLGGISCSAKSLSYVLTKPEGGYGVFLFPGGAAEATFARPGQYKLVLKERKGFAKVALKTGASLVPVFTFGEIDLFEQIQNPLILRFQKFVKSIFGFTLAIPVGSGFFQTSFGLIPRRKPLSTVVGAPIDVVRVENPTQEQIDELHQKFAKELVNLFETYKYEYLEDPKDKILELT